MTPPSSPDDANGRGFEGGGTGGPGPEDSVPNRRGPDGRADPGADGEDAGDPDPAPPVGGAPAGTEAPADREDAAPPVEGAGPDGRPDAPAAAAEGTETTPSGEGPSPERSDGTVECSGCGRVFDGRYCPQCGLAAGRPRSALEVVSTFLRDFVDVHRGLWPTLKALTVRPGAALRRQLGPGPRALMNPGRYLLAAIVVHYGTIRGLTGLGMREGAGQRLSAGRRAVEADAAGTTGADGQILTLLAELAGDLQAALTSQTYHIASSLLLALLLALTARQLFRARLGQGAQALTFSFLAVGQAVFLETALWAAYVPGAYLWTGTPVRTENTEVGVVVAVLYVAAAAGGTLGPGWRAAGKGALAALWASVEQLLVIVSAIGAYSLWLVYDRTARAGGPPAADAPLPTGDAETALLAVGLGLVVVSVVPLLLHAGLEAYHRLR